MRPAVDLDLRLASDSTIVSLPRRRNAVDASHVDSTNGCLAIERGSEKFLRFGAKRRRIAGSIFSAAWQDLVR